MVYSDSTWCACFRGKFLHAHRVDHIVGIAVLCGVAWLGSGSHENVRSFKIIAMEKQVQTSIMHQKRFGEGERLANKTS